MVKELVEVGVEDSCRRASVAGNVQGWNLEGGESSTEKRGVQQ